MLNFSFRPNCATITAFRSYRVPNSGTKLYDGLTTGITLTDDELELSILQKYVALHKVAQTAELPSADKCARELDMRKVLRELTNEEGEELDYAAELWIDRLAPRSPGISKGLLRPCSNGDINTSAHKYHARAFRDPVNKAPAPAWDRIRELQEKVSAQRPAVPEKELEQKFGILLSEPQEWRDFDTWRADAGEQSFPIGVLFIDIDDFKRLNSRHTETTVDETILLEAQTLLKQLTAHRGEAYRHGGDEFVVQLPNQNLEEVMLFAEKVREAFKTYRFKVSGSTEELTVSIGVAIWPNDGETHKEVLGAANKAEHVAKSDGGNTVRKAT